MNAPIQGNQQAPSPQLVATQQFKSGANWFYWIAGLSVVNSVIAVTGGNWYFIIGLGLNHLVNGIISAATPGGFSNASTSAIAVGFVFNMLIAGLFALFGFLAHKRAKWAFITGMILYTFDGLLFLIVSDFLSIGFHVFALYGMYRGFTGLQKLERLQSEAVIPQIQIPLPIK
jgi:hypothetical protein